MSTVEIFTDGACSGNPGPGGWGALLRYGETERELSGGEEDTTNNRMELTAAIEALNALKRPCKVVLTTDSVYVKDGITSWIDGWKKRGWKNSQKKPVKNEDLWKALDEARQIAHFEVGHFTVLGDQRVALGANAQTRARHVCVRAKSLGKRRVPVSDGVNGLRTLILVPHVHDKRVVHRVHGDDINAFGGQSLSLLHVAWQVPHVAGRRESARNAKDHHGLACGKLGNGQVRWPIVPGFDGYVREFVADTEGHGASLSI